MMSTNPFPGPVPYRAADRDRFFGRTDMAHKLRASILASRCMTVHGPSGAGKSSLMQAAVLPMLAEKSAARILRVDAWPEGEEPTKWLAEAMATLGLGGPSADETAHETVLRIAQGAARASSRPLVIYLDQLEQLLFAHRSLEETQPFFDCVEELVDTPWRTVRVVLSLREDYLGKFRDRLRDFRRITEGGFRVGPLNVAELTDAVVQAAALGEPAQEWSVQEMRELMMQVRFPGQAATEEAEAQSAYAQIICRALFQERAAGKTIDATEAEPILRGYLESTVADLGPLRKQAELLLEDHLVGADGSRTLRTEKELARVVESKDLRVILKQLEGAAILRAEEHHGSRYFEIGHDWLARRVYEQRQVREQALALEREREKSRTQRRFYATIAGISLAIATAGVTLGLYANQKRAAAERAEEHAKAAEQLADAQAQEAQKEAVQARNASRMAAARENQSDPTLAFALVREMESGRELPPRWRELALWAKFQGMAQVVLHHPDVVRSAAFSPDGKRIVTASWDKTARVWNADGTGKPLVLQGHEDRVRSAVFSPDGQHIVTASLDNTVRVWRADGTGKPLVLGGDIDRIFSADFSPDSKRIVTASWDKTARVWNADGTGKPLVLEGHQAPVFSAAFSADGTRIVTASLDKTARVWNADGTGKPLVLEGHQASVFSAAFSPDGTRIVTGSYDKTARVWNADGTGKPLVLDGHEDIVLSAAFSPDGARIVTASNDKTARVWNADGTGKPRVLEGHQDSVYSAAFGPDGTRIVTASDDKTARVWNANGAGRPLVLEGHQDHINSVAFSAEGTRIVTGSYDKTARVWKADGTGKPLVLDGHQDIVLSAAFSADGTRIVTASVDKTGRVWNADGTGKPRVLEGHQYPVISAAFSPDGTRIVTASMDKTARVWNADGTGKPLVLEGHQGMINSAAFSPDGTRIITASYDKTARVWNADGTGKPLVFEGHQDIVNSAAFSADGTRIVTASDDTTVRIWNADGTGKPSVLQGHTARMVSGALGGQGAWTPDGQQIVTLSDDKTLRIWNADGTGEPAILRIPEIEARSVAFSPDGTRIVTAGHIAKDPVTGKDKYWATVWPRFQPITGPDDPVLWTATRYCPPVELRMELLAVSAEEAERQFARCQARVAAAFEKAGSQH